MITNQNLKKTKLFKQEILRKVLKIMQMNIKLQKYLKAELKTLINKI